MTHLARYVGVALLFAVSVSCGSVDEGRTPDAPLFVDSAGVRIVENPAPDAIPDLGWRVGAQPELSIGSEGGEGEYQLFGVEDALRLGDGRVLVANGGTSEIRVFDASGRHLDSWGREGEGPGEFTGLAALTRWPGDSILAWDVFQNRLAVYHQDGARGRTQRLTQGEGRGAARFEGVLPDGSIIAASLVSFDPEDRTSGLVRRSREFMRVGPADSLRVSFGEHPDEEYYVRWDMGVIVRHPFRRSVHSAIWNGRVVISGSDRYEVSVYDPSGGLVMVTRIRHTPDPVTQGDVDRHLEGLIAVADESDRPTMLEVFEGMPPVERYPAFSDLVADTEGYLWVRDYTRPGDDRSRWTVLSEDGRALGRVALPDGLEVHRIGADYVLGRMTDEFDVEYVQLWGLEREVR